MEKLIILTVFFLLELGGASILLEYFKPKPNKSGRGLSREGFDFFLLILLFNLGGLTFWFLIN